MNASDITFGIEIECTAPRGAINAGGYHRGLPLPAIEGVGEGWNAQHDGSLRARGRDRVGVEIVSPVLRGADGLRQVKAVLAWLNGLGASVNASCGLHVHVGIGDDAEAVRRLTTLAANFETAIYAGTGTKSRERGRWCAPISTAREDARPRNAADVARFGNAAGRYRVLNLTNWAAGRSKAVEFRAFAGTLNYSKVVAYVRLCVGLAERAATAKRVTTWTAKAVSPTSPIHRKGGVGQTALTRLLYQLGWTKGRQPHVHGDLAGDGIPTLDNTKATLRRLAKKYDAAS